MNATTHIIRRKNDNKYFKVVTYPFLMTELNSANPDDLNGETKSIPSGDLSVLLLNGYKLVNGVNRISSSSNSSNSSRSRGRTRSNSYRSRGTGSTKSMSTMSSNKSSKGGKKSRNLKSKNKTCTKRRYY